MAANRNPEVKKLVHTELTRLTTEQKQLIQETFAEIAKAPVKNGLILFARYFSEFPHYKNIWPQFRAIPDSSLIVSDQLRNHASVYMSGLKEIVEKMDDDEILVNLTARIAISHVKWTISKQHITAEKCTHLENNGDMKRRLRSQSFCLLWRLFSPLLLLTHFQNMIPGLMDVLKTCLGDRYNQEVVDAWTTFYDVIGNVLNIQKAFVPRRYP
ncbi:unnamed protein product [Caenorhabditis auriculariae]|uniref:Globin domain-containing protein n=1 Tax=Caenorhabditis auriculariae TaxID=2777116 RepID=A0A8S1H4S2_9PELO|nr:unnamed protein product [Caenorhabditis auriculariae]